MPVLLQYLLSGVGFMAMIAYGYGQLRKGSNDSKFATIQLLKERVEALETKIEQLDKDNVMLATEIKTLHEAIDKRDKAFAEAILQMQGRDPQMQVFIELVKEYIHASTPLQEEIKAILPVVSKLDQFLNKQSF